ncbi:MAG: DUF2726 domain-containing protein, partial [Nitrospina sp.]|nr:DUF2726 domain-containing protein [Nitrospina sp.]
MPSEFVTKAFEPLLSLAIPVLFIILLIKLFFWKTGDILFFLLKKVIFPKEKKQKNISLNTKDEFDRRLSTSYFYSKRPISQVEQKLYYTLNRAVPDLLVLPQVAFSQFLGTRGGDPKENWSLFCTARQKVVDFLICDKAFNIICAIELDDSSHDNKAEDDWKRDEILKEAGINCIRYEVNQVPTH